MAIITVNIELPERKNAFFQAMSNLLPKEIFNVDPEFMIPRLQAVTASGTVVPLSVVKLFINGIDKSPVPDIVADADGFWSSPVNLAPGQNTIQVQFFPPEITQNVDTPFEPTLTVDNVLVHPTLFSRFSMANSLQTLLLDGNYLYLGNYVPPPVDANVLARFDRTTGASIVLGLTATSPTAGRVYAMAQDTNWLYASQVMGDSSIKLSRYVKDLSARVDIAGYATTPTSLYADGTNLFVVRTSGSTTFLSKVDPTTFALVGSEINISNGVLGESIIQHNSPGDDGTNLMIPTSRAIFGDSPGNDIWAGSPDLGANLIFENSVYYRKIKKSDMSDLGSLTTIACTNSPDEDFQGKNSLVSFGGFYYSVVLSNPGKVLKMQEGVQYGLPALIPIEVTPLPFSTLESYDTLPTLLKLGPDSRLYVVGNGGVARFVPGSDSIQHIPRGTGSIDVDANTLAIIDDSAPSKALAADIAIFTDRAQTFTVTTPAAPPSNLRVHFNNTHTRIGLGWDPTADGNAFIVEQAVNSDPFSEVGREYIGNAFSVRNTSFPVFQSGDMLRYRVKTFNSVGTSVPSAEATWTVPYLTPPLGDCTSMLLTSVVGSSVTVSFDDGEIVLGGPIDASTNRYHNLSLERSLDGLTNWTEVAFRGMIPDNVQPDGTPLGPYTFYYNPSTRANTSVTMVDATATAYPYYYRVRVHQKGLPITFPSLVYTPGAYSNVIQVDAPPATPINVAWEAGWEGAFVSWAPGVGGGVVTDYTIKRSTDNSASYPVSFPVGLVTAYHDGTAFGNAQVRYDKIFASGPGGTSADSPIQGGAVSLAPVLHEIKLATITSGNGGVFLIGAYAYTVALGPGSTSVILSRITLADSSVRSQNLAVYPSVGTFMTIHDAIEFGGFIYAILTDQGEANGRILKIDPATMLLDSSLALTTGVGIGAMVTDGTDCWAIMGPNGSVKVTHFNPVTMLAISVGASFGASVSSRSATFFGGSIYVTVANSSLGTTSIYRVDPTTLGVVETVGITTLTSPGPITNDGVSLYVLGANGSAGRIAKFAVGPMAYSAETADLGSFTTSSMMYHAASNAIYLAHRNTVSVGGTFNSLMKVGLSPFAFVSAISQFHFGSGATYAGIKTDGTYIYFSSFSGHVAREAIASF